MFTQLVLLDTTQYKLDNVTDIVTHIVRSTAPGFVIEERLDSIKKSAMKISKRRVQELSKKYYDDSPRCTSLG